MKVSEMNARQKKAFYNIYHCANYYIGGLENTFEDCRQEEEEYKNALATLNDHEGLVNDIYSMATSEIYDAGFCQFGKAAESYLKDIRFCGKDWLLERVEKRVSKMGY